MNKLLLLPFLSLGNSLYAASGIIDWGATGNSVLSASGGEGRSHFRLDSNGNTSIDNDDTLDTVFNPMDSQLGRLAGTEIGGGQVVFGIEGIQGPGTGTSGTMQARIDRLTNDPWGSGHRFGQPAESVGNGPRGQEAGESGLLFRTQGGPWATDDGKVTVSFDFSAYADGAVDNLEFGLFGINHQKGRGLAGADIVTVSALDANGLAIDISSFFTTSTTPNFEQSGTTSVVFDSSDEKFLQDISAFSFPFLAPESDHQDSDGNVIFDSGSQRIKTLTITYEAFSEGSSPTEDSTGFLLSDLSFETVPEPSVFMFSFVGLAGLMLHRKRD